jgi:hypothetical protein
MPFVVPKFIERKPKIVGPLTFQQFLYVGGAAAVCVFLYFTASPLVFFLSLLILVGGSIFLAFFKIEGIPITTVIGNFFSFSFSSKIYLWKKSGLPPKMIRKEPPKKEKKEPDVLNIAEKSRLKNLAERIEKNQR